MQQSSRRASEILHQFGTVACTDVTGFGLLGHLVEMLQASKVGARLEVSRLPVLEGASEVVLSGVLSSLHEDNLHQRRVIRNAGDYVKLPQFSLLFDPQTSGGLLASLPVECAEQAIHALHQGGYPSAAIIGTVAHEEGVYLA